MSKKVIKILDDFSKEPYGRLRSEWAHCGEAFRDDLLIPAFNEFDIVEVNLDGVKTYGSSFLEEAFGGLVRKTNFSKGELKRRLIISSKMPSRIKQIQRLIDRAYENKK